MQKVGFRWYETASVACANGLSRVDFSGVQEVGVASKSPHPSSYYLSFTSHPSHWVLLCKLSSFRVHPVLVSASN